MERKRAFETHHDHTRPDRSRSPHQLHPWEKNSSETKSVLYSAEVHFHKRSPHKQRSPSKQSSSKAYPKSSKIPLKQSQPERVRTTSHPQTRIDAGVQDYVEKLQKWSSMHSPSKFMAGMMSADGTYEAPLEATPKRRSRGPWFVEHYSKVGGPSQSTEKAQVSKNNIIRIEKENRRTDEYLTSKLKANEVASSKQSVQSTSTELIKTSQAVATDDDGYAIPTTEGQTGPMPSFQELETPIFATPSKIESPNEFFYTPMTHPRSNPASATPDPKHHDTPSGQIPKFSLINVKKFSSTSLSKHDTSIKERTETQLASFEKASRRLDKALQEASEVLQHPIKLALPSDIPPFSDQRQTLDVAQVENLRNRDVARESLRHSLPSKPLFESFSYENGTADNQNGTKKASFSSPVVEEKTNAQTHSGDVPLSKALGASMAAELAYAEKAREIQTHLNKAHHLATLVHQKAEQQLYRADGGDDIDRVLNSISLRDDSLATSDDDEKPKIDMVLACKSVSLNSEVQGTAKPINPSVKFNIMPSSVGKATFLTPAQRNERKAKVEEYLRMYNVLHTLQAAVFKLKRSKCNPEQVPKIEELSKVADKEYREAIVQAKSWLRKKISQHEFLQIVKRQQKKVYDESEECSNRIKRLLSAQAAAQNTRQDDAPPPENLAIPISVNENELPPVRMDTRALNESVECDLWNLSARSLRRNLDIRREQAEILNRSFEEKTRDIEQKTKKSITAQIIQYDRVISERTELLNKLDEISAEEKVSQPTPTPRRAGVEPLDLGQLEDHAIVDEKNISASGSAGFQQSSLSEDSTDVGIRRTISQSTVYEDSLSHFDEEEAQSSASSSTLYQSDVDDAKLGKENIDAEPHPSRRTLDTAETLAMLSRQTVTVVGDENSLDNVDQILHDLTESTTFTLKESANEEVEIPSVPIVSPDIRLLNNTFTIDDTGPILPNASSEEADQTMNVVHGVGKVLETPHESVRLEVSMSNIGTWSEAEVNVPEKTATHVVLDAPTLETPSIGNAVDESEIAEFGDNNLNSRESHEEMKEDSKECEKEREFFISDAEGSGDRLVAELGADAPPFTVDETYRRSRDDFNNEGYESDTNKEDTETVGENVIHEIEDETQLSAQSDTTTNTGLANEMSEATELTATDEDAVNAVESTSVVAEEEKLAQRSSGTDSIKDDDASSVENFHKNKVESQDQEKLISEGVRERELRSEEKPEKDAYELSFIDSRVSMGLNRSELCDNLSSSILQSLLDSPRRRSLPRYTLNDSLLNDSILATPKSPRAPKERFNTKMPGSSPRLLDDSLKSDLANIIVNDLVTNAVDEIEDLKESAAPLSFLRKEEQTVSPAQNLFEQLDDTYEDLLSIEKPTSSLHPVLSPTDRTPGFPQLVADTPRKEPPTQPSTEDAKESRLTELSQVLQSDNWMKAKCQQLVKPLWSRICAKGHILPLYDDFVAVPVVSEEASLEGEDEQLMVENKTLLIWATMIELASRLWPESQTLRLSSKMLPIPKSEEEFTKKATCYVLEQLSEMPPSHRYNRISRPPPPPYADTSVDKAVGRHVYQEDPYNFGREVDKEYRKLCEEIIEQVGDRFVSAEVQVLQHRLVASDIDTTPLTPSAMTSGDYGRPSLSRLSVSSRVSIGSLSTKSPLRIVPEVSEL